MEAVYREKRPDSGRLVGLPNQPLSALGIPVHLGISKNYIPKAEGYKSNAQREVIALVI